MASSAFQFAEGEDTQQLARDADALLQQGWAKDGDGMGIMKTFHFKTYFKAVVSYLLFFLVWSKTGAASTC
jgi:4a-hydroxytetrahydrobiopterin dehydratase